MDNLVKSLEVFRNKRVLVTGDTGFKGSWLSLWLKELGADVVGFALPPQRDNDLFNVTKLSKSIHHINGDIRELSGLQKVFKEFQPEFLFHLAAQPLVRYSYEEPKLTIDTNVSGSVNVLECVRQSTSLKSVIYVTSDKCYYNKEWIWGYRENDELGGRDPYSASKAAAEIIFSSYLDSYFKSRSNLGIASVRAGNVIGGGDWSQDRIVPDSIKNLINQTPIVLRNPDSTRPWQHVLEPLSGYLMLAQRLYFEPQKYLGSWNFGPKTTSIHTVGELASEIIKCWGTGEIQYNIDQNAPHEAGLLHLNIDKASQLMGWQPRWNFNKTVYETVKWYKQVHAGLDPYKVLISQIHDYMEDNYA